MHIYSCLSLAYMLAETVCDPTLRELLIAPIYIVYLSTILRFRTPLLDTSPYCGVEPISLAGAASSSPTTTSPTTPVPAMTPSTTPSTKSPTNPEPTALQALKTVVRPNRFLGGSTISKKGDKSKTEV